jgi:hypothetical protein
MRWSMDDDPGQGQWVVTTGQVTNGTDQMTGRLTPYRARIQTARLLPKTRSSGARGSDSDE